MCVAGFAAHAAADTPGRARPEVADTLERVKPGVVGVGTVHPTRAPRAQLRGTGFAVGDGTLVVTCAHVVDAPLDATHQERLAIFVGRGEVMTARAVKLVASDREHDLALLRLEGAPLPALALGDQSRAREGWQLYFTGFPLGPVLGLYPVTQRAGLAAIVPRVTPFVSAAQLSPGVVKAARDPYPVFMLDAVAYPGHSGSPLWHPDSGEVLGIVNSVQVKGAKEAALTAPSGISYAIPAGFIQALLAKAGIAP